MSEKLKTPNVMFTIYNNVEGVNVFEGNEEEFIQFTNRIVIENEDTDIISSAEEALVYIETYCGNLELV